MKRLLDKLKLILSWTDHCQEQLKGQAAFSDYSPRGVKAFDGSLGLDTPMAFTAKMRTS